MNKFNLLIFLCFLCFLCFGVISANAQSGSAHLKVFVHAGEIGNSGVSLEDVKVVLRPLDVWSKSMQTVEAESENNGYYSAEVSFGEYELTVSADGFQTYRAIVYLPSSVSFTWGVRLHEIEKESKELRKKNKQKSQ